MRPPDRDAGSKGPGEARGAGARLSPEMASFRGLVLAFVRTYLTEWGQSPSLGEIAAGTGSNRTRVKRAVLSLERAGLLLRTPGTRGLALPDEIERARLTLARAGLLPSSSAAVGQQGTPSSSAAVGQQGTPSSSAAVGQQGAPVTNPTLLPPPALDYPARASRSRRGKRRHGGNSGNPAT